jgi:hypothetical protein
MTANEKPVVGAEPERSLTRQEFCALEQISSTTYHKMMKEGHGPDVSIIPGTRLRRITPEAHREWRARMRAYGESLEVKLKEQRRLEITRRAGEIAAESPLHVSKRRKAQASA